MTWRAPLIMVLMAVSIVLIAYGVNGVLADNETSLVEPDVKRETEAFSFRCDGTYGVYLAGHTANIFVVPDHTDCVLNVDG